MEEGNQAGGITRKDKVTGRAIAGGVVALGVGGSTAVALLVPITDQQAVTLMQGMLVFAGGGIVAALLGVFDGKKPKAE